MATSQSSAGESPRPRGRPRLSIDNDAVADAVAEILHEGGYEALSVPDVADKLSISRATLYRTVPTKVDLLGILFERSTRDLIAGARSVVAKTPDSAEQLAGLIRLHVGAAVEMRRYMAVFFGGGDLPQEVYLRWHSWSRRYENIWVKAVTANMRDHQIAEGDPLVTTRLILGMLIWVSRWYRPGEKMSPDEIADTAIHLLRVGVTTEPVPVKRSNNSRTRRSPTKKTAK